MKLIVKADDFGYTRSYNDGTMKAIEEGIVTVVDVMLDTPGTVDALERIRNYPWISVGWHGGHFWGKPVADPSLVPSMINAEGKFKWRRDKKLQETVVYEEALIEMRAELDRCIRILGCVPAYTEIHGDSVMDRAKRIVCDEYGIRYGFAEVHRGDQIIPAEAKYRTCSIYKVDPTQQYIGALSKDRVVLEQEYHPINHFKQYLAPKSELTYLSPWHPGYCDEYIAAESSMRECRDIDVRDLCSEELKQWIIENRVELVNYQDAIEGTRNYQNYLQVTKNPLWTGYFK